MSLVEYYDPDNLFPLIEQQLKGYLPLQNLHWDSPTRSVRSIVSLPVEFVPCPSTQNGANSSKKSEDSSSAVVSVRRHQVSGLQVTPLLKIFLLRCDDKESYKNVKRSEVQKWRDDQSPQKKKSFSIGNDQHEWLIIHVVFPNTVAASQPRYTQAAEASDGEDSLKEKSHSKGKWPGKKSRPIIEKLRSDFNESAKSGPDRVAQVRPRKQDIPSDRLPTGLSGDEDYVETSKVSSKAWRDLIDKFELLILRSFDLRVTQYEDDIGEKEAQRLLPGWNFCTYFVLKEGLARTFEGVGLFQDALTVYDELAIELETLLDLKDTETQAANALVFETSSSDLQHLLSSMIITGEVNSDEPVASALLEPLSPNRKDFRNLIVANQISIFDFLSYIFSQQHVLLLRLAFRQTRASSQNDNVHPLDISRAYVEDYTALLQIYENLLDAIRNLAAHLRQDLHAGASESGLLRDNVDIAVTQITAAWVFGAVEQVLKSTEAAHPVKPKSKAPGTLPADSVRHDSIVTELWEPSSHIKLGESIKKAAARRAELLVIQGNILLAIARQRKWSMMVEGNTESVSATNASDDHEPGHGDSRARAADLLSLIPNCPLSACCSSLEKLCDAFAASSHEAAWLYRAAERKRTSQGLLANIGHVKLQLGDVASAAAYFSHLVSQGDILDEVIDVACLHGHLLCVKALNRKNDYIRVGLRILAQLANCNTMIGQIQACTHESGRRSGPWHTQSQLNCAELVTDLVEMSRQLIYDVTTPTKGFFTGIDYDLFISFHNNHDGFRLGLRLCQLVSNDLLAIDSIKLYLSPIEDGQGQEICLETGPIMLGADRETVWLEAKVSRLGTYVVDRISVHLGRTAFIYEPHEKPEKPGLFALLHGSSPGSVQDIKGPFIQCYQRAGALTIALVAGRKMQLGQPPRLELTINRGSNDVHDMHISMRSGTAGLRLHTSEATAVTEELELLSGKGPGIIEMSGCSKNSSNTIEIPYTTETNANKLHIQYEANYTTEHGNFVYASHADVNVELLLDVTVEDLFREHVLYSRFLLRSKTQEPLRVLGMTLASSESFSVASVLAHVPNAIISTQTPLSVTYKVLRSPSSAKSDPKPPTERALPLTIKYSLIQDDVLNETLRLFLSTLAESPFCGSRHLLASHLKASLTQHYSSSELEHAGSTFQCRLPSYQALKWRTALAALPQTARRPLRTWLREWHASNSTVRLPELHDESLPARCPSRTLHVDFGVPSLKFLHTASLRVKPLDEPSSTKSIAELTRSKSTAVTTLGVAQHYTLCTHYTRRWDLDRPLNSSLSGPEKDAASPRAESFTFELLLDPTAWLVSGARRRTYTAPPEHEIRFPLTLIALRTGALPLPSVEIRLANDALSTIDNSEELASETVQKQLPAVRAGPGLSPAIRSSPRTSLSAGLSVSGSVTGDGNGGFGCETDCSTAGDTVRVVEGWHSVCIGLGDPAEIAHEDADGTEVVYGDTSRAEVLESLP